MGKTNDRDISVEDGAGGRTNSKPSGRDNLKVSCGCKEIGYIWGHKTKDIWIAVSIYRVKLYARQEEKVRVGVKRLDTVKKFK